MTLIRTFQPKINIRKDCLNCCLDYLDNLVEVVVEVVDNLVEVVVDNLVVGILVVDNVVVDILVEAVVVDNLVVDMVDIVLEQDDVALPVSLDRVCWRQ